MGPYPAGFSRVLFWPTARYLGAGRTPMSRRLNLASGHCYHLQLRAEAGGPVQLKVSDADDKPLMSQSLAPKANTSLSSKKICPKRTEAHRLILSGAGPVRAVAVRLVARPLARDPMFGVQAMPFSPEDEPCFLVKNARSRRFVCGGWLGVSGARRKK